MSPPLQQQQGRGKRHSFSIMQAGPQHPPGHRHSAEILTPPELTAGDTGSAEQSSQPQSDVFERAGSQRHRRSGSTDSSVSSPAAYIALYAYKPQKADEMELRKGGIYMVTERCQDGWFKGTSNRTQKGGVFPGNYVAPAKAVSGSVQAQLRGLTRPSTAPSQSASSCSSPRSNGSSQLEPPSTVSYTRVGAKQPGSPRLVSCQPPELPPRACSPQVAAVSASWHGDSAATATPIGRSQSAVMAPPNVVVQPRPASAEKPKERKEKPSGGVSLMKRLTSIKKSKSPPPMSNYSMDNPVFESNNLTVSIVSSPSHPVHVRLIEPASSNGVPGSHRKSNSLDAGSLEAGRKQTKPAPPPVRERFRCIVPYPPNSEYELELRVGDIIYVHKKRDDGWYKGTQQRTGRTGLFPASFVEAF